MSLATARRDIEKRIQSNWATTPVVFDNQPYAPRAGQAWVRVQIFEEDVNRINIGNPGYHRVVGIIILSIYVPVNTGTQTARQYADTLATLFRDVEFSGIICREAVPSTIGEIILPAGGITGGAIPKESGWYQYDIRVRFQWDGVYSV